MEGKKYKKKVGRIQDYALVIGIGVSPAIKPLTNSYMMKKMAFESPR